MVNLANNFVAARCQHTLQHASYRLKVLVDLDLDIARVLTIENLVDPCVISAALFRVARYFYHQAYKVMNWENVIVLNWILRVDGLDEGPILLHHFKV